MAADLLDDLLSARVGVIQAVTRQPRDRDEPPLVRIFSATLAHFAYRRLSASERVGGGKGVTDADARAGAIGEAVERYCAYQPDPYRIVTAAWADMAPPAVRPVDLVLYSDSQYQRPGFRYQRWTEDLPMGWVRGVELPSRSTVAVPAGLTWLASDVTPHLAPTTSNGLAAGPDRASAELSGLYELMERDAFLITWMNRLPAVEVDLPPEGAVGAIAGHYSRLGVQLRAFLLPSDLPGTTVLAVTFDDDPTRPAQVVGLGCHLDPASALLKAVLELCQSRRVEIPRFRDQRP